MRALIYQTLVSDPILSADVGDRVFAVNMEDAKPSAPYIVYRFNPATPRVVPARNQPIQVWVHDKRGDYSRIDALIARIKEVLAELSSEDNVFGVEWVDDSEDLYDDIANTITRYSRYQVVMSNG